MSEKTVKSVTGNYLYHHLAPEPSGNSIRVFSDMLIGYMRVSSDSDQQTTDRQRDALQAAGVDEHHLFQDQASGARDDRLGLTQALAFLRPADVRGGGSLTGWGGPCPTGSRSSSG